MDTKKAMAWFIIIVMSLSILGFVGLSFFADDGSSEAGQEYNGFTFYQYSGQWRVNVAGQWYYFQYLPTELEAIPLAADLSEWRNFERIYLGFLPNDTLDVVDDLNFLSSVFYVNNIISQQACLEEEGCPDIPLMDCDNKFGFIMQSGSVNTFGSTGHCLVLEAVDSYELHKLNERLIYNLLGIM